MHQGYTMWQLRRHMRRRVQVKQKGTPDPGVPFGPMRRSACRLLHGMSAPLFWDDADAPKSVVVRFAMQDSWEWSGGFELQEREDYFGLRMHRVNGAGIRDGVTVILPVSISVEASGVVLVSLKSQQNLPPYSIRNCCTSVTVSVSQMLVRTPAGCPVPVAAVYKTAAKSLPQVAARRHDLQSACREIGLGPCRST